MREELPRGTVTFLFTDVEGSTLLLDELGPEAYAAALAEHRRLIREACSRQGGIEVDTQGDAFFVAFSTAPGALEAASEIVATLAPGPVRVRAGLHTGTPFLAEEGYVGHDVHRAARIAAAAHGGQVVVSTSTAALTRDGLRDLGEHRFKDLAAPERVYQLGDGDFPPLASLYRTNLPVTATPFLGRERELSDVVSLLAREDVRAVTLTGPGGTGKTRLALQAAAESAERFADGTWWVPLAPLRDPGVVPVLIGQAVGASNGLAAHIADKRMLLLLDNFEHLLPAVTEIASLLAACPNLEVLATSREVLQLQAEHTYAVPTMDDEDGTQLFVARATAASGEASAPETVAELCRRLDNLPLAIELAAARTRHLAPEQLLERLSQRLDLLKGGRDADPRQQTLRATIEWSYDLLEEDEQRLFARLSLFAGGCTLEAAEAVSEADLDELASLVDKSLVRTTGGRYWMLETIRAFAAERLRERGEEAALRLRHAEFLTDLAPSLGFTVEAIEAGAVQRHDLGLAELDNFRSAIAWAHDADPVLSLRLACSLENLWISYNAFEGKRLFEELVPRAVDAPPPLRAHATRCRANFEIMAGDIQRGTQLYEASAEQFRELGDEQGETIARFRVGANLVWLGENERARRMLEECLARSREHGFRITELQVLGTLGSLDLREGHVARGFERQNTALRFAQEVGYKWMEANVRGTLAWYSLELGRFDEAEEHARGQLALARIMSDRRHALQALGLLAQLAASRGDQARAGRLWGALEAEELRGPAGRRPRLAMWEEDRATFEAVVLADADDAFERERAEGRRMTLEDAVAYATSDA